MNILDGGAEIVLAPLCLRLPGHSPSKSSSYLALPAVIRWISPRTLPGLLLAGIVMAPLLRLSLLLGLEEPGCDRRIRASALSNGFVAYRRPAARITIEPSVVLGICRGAKGVGYGALLCVLAIGMIYFNHLGEEGPFPYNDSWLHLDRPFYAVIMLLSLTQPTSLLARLFYEIVG